MSLSNTLEHPNFRIKQEVDDILSDSQTLSRDRLTSHQDEESRVNLIEKIQQVQK